MREVIYSPYFCVLFNESSLRNLKEQISQILSNQMNLTVTLLPDPHVTINYSMGAASLNDLQNLAEEISEAPFKMRIQGIRSIRSKYYGATIISLILESSDDFEYSKHLIKELLESEDSNFKVVEQKRKNGFEAHVSLLTIPLQEDYPSKLIAQNLELILGGVGQNIHAASFVIYDANRQKLIEKPFLA